MSTGVPAGRAPSQLDDAELEQQGTQAHATRNWVFLHGTAEQLAQHTHRMLALEQEYLHRHPHRTWQGSTTAPDPDPERAVLAAVATAGGRMHKLEVQQAARAAGLRRSSLATLYGRGLLVTDGPDRVLTDDGRAWLSVEPAAPTEPVALQWVAEADPRWDADKRRVVGGAAEGVFALAPADGEPLAGDWWSARDPDGRVLGHGWMDVTWGEAEVLLAVDPASRRGGVGGWVLDRLEDEAAARGLNYVLNTVRPTHPDRDAVHDWLAARGYTGSGPDAARRKRVGVVPEPPVPAPTSGGSDRGPGQEEQGGYVDVEDQQY